MTFHDLSLDERMQIVERGTEYFARYLGGLADPDLAAASLLDGWTRGHLVVHLAFNAAEIGRAHV